MTAVELFDRDLCRFHNPGGVSRLDPAEAKRLSAGRCWRRTGTGRESFMLKSEIQTGGVYFARVSRNVVRVRVDLIRTGAWPSGRASTVYDVTNLDTGRTTRFRSAARFRGPAPAGKI